MSGYLFLVLTVFCFFGLGVLHKVADFQKCRPLAINAFLFLWAGLLITAYTFSLGSSFSVPHAVGGGATLCGLLASVAILCFQTGIRYGKISTSWLVINLPTVVPTVLSIVYYGETCRAEARSRLIRDSSILIVPLERQGNRISAKR